MHTSRAILLTGALAACIGLVGCSEASETAPLGGGPVTPGTATPMPNPATTPTDAELAAGQVTLGRGACFGTCPSYDVTLRGDGTVTWHGDAYVKAKGDRTQRVDPRAARSLLRELRTGEFSRLHDEYAERVTDIPGYSIEVTVGGMRKHVRVRTTHEPPEFMRAADRIDAVANTKGLVGPPQKHR